MESNIYIYVFVYTYYMHIHSENVKFIVVNLKEDVIKIYFFYLDFLQVDYDKIYNFRMCMYKHTHTYISSLF